MLAGCDRSQEKLVLSVIRWRFCLVVYSFFVVAPIVCGGLSISLFLLAILCVLSSFAIISLGEERAGCFTFVVFRISCSCYRSPCLGLFVAFLGHTHFFVVQTIYHVPIFVCMLKFEPDEYWLHDLLGVVMQCYDGDIVLYWLDLLTWNNPNNLINKFALS